MTGRRGRSISGLLLVIFLTAGMAVVSCAPKPGPADQGDAEITYLGQDLDALTGADGQIVAVEQLTCGPPFTDLLEVHKIHYMSDGLKVVGFIIRPAGVEGPLPAIIYNRGGNREDGKIDDQLLPVMGTYASKGYVVIASQYRGNDGGQGNEEFGGSDVNDVLNLIPLAQSLPFVSPDKLAMLGASRGGMMTYIALSRTDKIRAAAVYGGVADLFAWYDEREDALRKVLVDLIGGTPAEKEVEYKLRSATYWPDKINTPLLILHGEADDRVSVNHALALTEKLDALGKTVELVVYPQGTHGLLESWRDRDTRILEWFEAQLR